MYQDLDATLATLLTQQLPPTLVKQISISFLTPDHEFPPGSVTSRRSTSFSTTSTRTASCATPTPPSRDSPTAGCSAPEASLRVDVSYLVTAWANAGSPTPAQDEHSMLGEVTKVLLLHREIPAEVLQGSMKSQALPIRGVIGSMGEAQTRGELWQALGDRPRSRDQVHDDHLRGCLGPRRRRRRGQGREDLIPLSEATMAFSITPKKRYQAAIAGRVLDARSQAVVPGGDGDDHRDAGRVPGAARQPRRASRLRLGRYEGARRSDGDRVGRHLPLRRSA